MKSREDIIRCKQLCALLEDMPDAFKSDEELSDWLSVFLFDLMSCNAMRNSSAVAAANLIHTSAMIAAGLDIQIGKNETLNILQDCLNEMYKDSYAQMEEASRPRQAD